MPTQIVNGHIRPESESRGQRRNHVIRKSQSVGVVGVPRSTRLTGALKDGPEMVEEEERGGGGSLKTPYTGLLRRKNPTQKSSSKTGLGNFFKWFKGDSKAASQDQLDKTKMKKGVRGHDLITSNTQVLSESNLVSIGSVDSLCSVASTASFAYVPIGAYKPTAQKEKRIPIALNCSKDTYQKRMNKGADQNMSLTSKYQLLPADYSPPTLRRGTENFSAISGPALPSGPTLPVAVSTWSDDDDSESTLSGGEPGMSNYSAFSPSLRSKEVVIKPKERRGEMSLAMTMPKVQNSLKEIGNLSSSESTPNNTSRNPFEVDDSTLKHTAPIVDEVAEAIVVVADVHCDIETQSNAPTAVVGLDEDRMKEVRPVAHKPGKRRAPDPPKRFSPPNRNGNRQASPAKKVVTNPFEVEEDKAPVQNGLIPATVPGQTPENPPKFPVVQSASASFISNGVKDESPAKPWYKKGLFHSPSGKNISSKNTPSPPSSSGAKKSAQNGGRPISLLASISDFDRQAAEIVSQRQKDAEQKQKANDKDYYVNGDQHDEPQEVIDQIMADVEKKMECLDAIEKHNDKWADRMHNPPEMKMKDLVLDLNSFIDTTQKEMSTPKTKRKASRNLANGDTTPSWTCIKCTLINSKDAKVCSVCGASKPCAGEASGSIFEAPDPDPEKMPSKGNVLDRVVQFTAIQMCAEDKKPASKVWTPTEIATSTPQKSDYSKVSQAVVSKTEDVKPSTLDSHRNLLQKEERDAIIAKWKQEHDEKTRAREEHFRNFKTPQDDVIKVQADLLKEANRKLDMKIQREEEKRRRALEKQKFLEKQPEPAQPKPIPTQVNQDRVKPEQVKLDEVKRPNLVDKPATDRSKPNQYERPKVEVKESKISRTNSITEKSATLNNKIPQKFDFLKTPSYFVEKCTPALSPECTLKREEPENPDREEIRKLRVAFFERDEPTSERDDSIKESRVVQLKKCSASDPIYDELPKGPPRPVSPKFFERFYATVEKKNNSTIAVQTSFEMDEKNNYETIEFKRQPEPKLAKNTKLESLARKDKSRQSQKATEKKAPTEPSYSNMQGQKAMEIQGLKLEVKKMAAPPVRPIRQKLKKSVSLDSGSRPPNEPSKLIVSKEYQHMRLVPVEENKKRLSNCTFHDVEDVNGYVSDSSSVCSFKTALYADVEFRNGLKPYQAIEKPQKSVQSKIPRLTELRKDVEKERKLGAIRKQTNLNRLSVASGDVVDDVLYISRPLKPQAKVLNELHSFQLIAPDNFEIYQALSASDVIDKSKPLAANINEFKEGLVAKLNQENKKRSNLSLNSLPQDPDPRMMQQRQVQRKHSSQSSQFNSGI